MAERTRCCIPLCRRTTKEQHDEWICYRHWPLVSKEVKRRRRLLKNAINRRGVLTPQMAWMDRQLWERAKREATERSMGI